MDSRKVLLGLTIGLLLIVAAGYAFLAQAGTTNAKTSTSTVITTGQPPLASTFTIANVTVAPVPYFVPQEVVPNPDSGRIYVTDGTNNATVVNASDYSIAGTITLPGSPRSGIAIDAVSDTIYVSTWGCTNTLNVSNSCQAYPSWPAGGIVEINGTNDHVVGEIPYGVDRLAVNPATHILYGVVGQRLLSIDGHSGSLISNTSLGADVFGIAVNTKTNMVYALACKVASLGCQGGELIGLDGASTTMRFVVPLNFNFIGGLVVDSSTDTIYTVAVQQNPTLLSINGASGAIRYSSDIAACGIGAGGTTLAFDAALKRIFITGSGYLLEVDASNGHSVNMLSAPNTWRVAISPDGTKVYLAVEHQSERFGYLLVLPSDTGESYVNSSALKLSGGCLP
jgi:hypothetical protein